jgi:hypothetical protein
MDHILKRTYLSKAKATRFFTDLVLKPNLSLWPDPIGDDLVGFWRSVNFLKLQGPGSSQTAMLQLLDKTLEDAFGFQTKDCGTPSGPSLYLDDCLFSGGRVRNDVIGWLRAVGELWGQLYIVLIGRHKSGGWYTENEIEKIASEVIAIVEWLPSSIDVEDRKAYINVSEVLRPAAVPDDPLVREYAQRLAASGYSPILRRPGWKTRTPVFSSETGRHTVEQFFLRAGAYIRSQAAYPDEDMHPLGYSRLKTFGFGALVVTYRNIANNCPLVLWYGDANAPSYHPFSKWYPLFPKKMR